jgi:hypothetical protein
MVPLQAGLELLARQLVQPVVVSLSVAPGPRVLSVVLRAVRLSGLARLGLQD